MAQDREQRRLAAILVADVVGYSRLMGADESGTLSVLRAHRSEIIDPKISDYRGRIVKTMGDGLLVEFPSVVDAVQCAIDVQEEMARRNADVAAERRVEFRIGVNVGDVIVEGDDLFGDGVNIASRLEGLADAGGICISGDSYRQVNGKLTAKFQDLGERQLKNISDPMRAYKVLPAVPVRGTSIGPAEPIKDRPSVAVLCFDNMSGDPEQEYFSDGIAEDIITSLSKIAGLLVIARNSTFVYKGQAVDVTEVSRKLGVRTVLQGSVRKAGNRVRITAQLIDGATGGHLWAERYDRDLDDIFAVQDDVTSEIVSALKVRLSETERAHIGHRELLPSEVYDLILRGREKFALFTKEDNVEARQFFEEALELTPDSAEVHARLALTYSQDANMAWTSRPREMADLALKFAKKAIDLDPTLPVAHGAIGTLYLWRREHDKAIAEHEKWIELDPNNADAYLQLSTALAFAGEPEKALPLVKESMRLNPNYSFLTMFTVGQVNYMLGNLDEAVAFFEQGVSRNPNFIGNVIYLAAVYSQMGDQGKAQTCVAKLKAESVEAPLRQLAELIPFKFEKDKRRLTDALRNAGLAV